MSFCGIKPTNKCRGKSHYNTFTFLKKSGYPLSSGHENCAFFLDLILILTLQRWSALLCSTRSLETSCGKQGNKLSSNISLETPKQAREQAVSKCPQGHFAGIFFYIFILFGL